MFGIAEPWRARANARAWRRCPSHAARCRRGGRGMDCSESGCV